MIIFGYGSLMNIDSAREDVPSLKKMHQGKLKGFRRVFNLRAKRVNSPCGLIAMLDIENDKNSYLNGVYFEIKEDELNTLKNREILYKFIEVDIVGEGEEKIKALVVQAKDKPRTNYKFHCDVQDIYLRTCLDGAKSQGEDFLEEFKRTTFIDNKNLLELNMNQ